MPTEKNLTVDEFKRLSDEYFANCKAEGDPLTITGLALALGFASKQSIYDYSKYPGYEHVVGRAKLMVEYGYERKLLGDGSATGAIFGLKNFGWKDTISNELSGPNGGAQEHKWLVEFINATPKN